jgi:hypothetical protein
VSLLVRINEPVQPLRLLWDRFEVHGEARKLQSQGMSEQSNYCDEQSTDAHDEKAMVNDGRSRRARCSG